MFRSICQAKPRLPQQTPGSPISSFRPAHFSTNEPFEEETLPYYSPRQFYPVRVGQELDSTYKVLGKLGYGSNSTVWLCRDMRDNGFVSVKHVSSLGSTHPGQAHIRGLHGMFEVTGPDGNHVCLVHPPMHMTVHGFYRTYLKLYHSYMKTRRWYTQVWLQQYLPETPLNEADIHSSNIMLTVVDPSVLEAVEASESQNLLPRKIIDDARTIYSSQKLGLPRDSLWGQPALCDLGEARIGERHNGLIQPEQYRAPEVLFEIGWDSSVDVWSVGNLIWDLLENKRLFNALDEDGESSGTHHVAEMVAYLGLPPLEYVKRSEVTRNVFDDEGHWIGAGGTTIPSKTFENSMSAVDGDSKRLMLEFLRSMLRWEPEKRKKASDLLKDPWLTGSGL